MQTDLSRSAFWHAITAVSLKAPLPPRDGITITLPEGVGGYRDITAQLSAAKAMGKLDEVSK